jgi:hypothetical protein
LKNFLKNRIKNRLPIPLKKGVASGLQITARKKSFNLRRVNQRGKGAE